MATGFDTGGGLADGALVLRPIGRLRTPFRTLAECPRNGRQLEPAPACMAEVDAAYREGLVGLEGFSHLILLYWLGPQSDALTIRPAFDVQSGGQARGVFATRAPVRPNPIGLSVVLLERIGAEELVVRNLDCLDGTPLLDIKPYLPSTDAEPEAVMGWLTPHRTRKTA